MNIHIHHQNPQHRAVPLTEVNDKPLIQAHICMSGAPSAQCTCEEVQMKELRGWVKVRQISSGVWDLDLGCLSP